MLHIDDVPKLTWKLSSPETSDDEPDVQPTGNDQTKQVCECSSKGEASNTTGPHKNMCSELNNNQRTLEGCILDSDTDSDLHDKSHATENDTLMDIDISLSPTLLKENGCSDTWDNLINAVLAEDRDFNQISTDIIPQVDNDILTLSTDEEQVEEQSSCQINECSEQQKLSVEKTPQAEKSNMLSSSSKCEDQLEDLFENETEMMGERLSQTLIISPQASQSDLQCDSLAVSAQMPKMQNQVSPKKTAKYIISQPKGRGKNMRKLMSSLNRCKQLKVKSQKKQAKQPTVARSSKNNQICYDRKYNRHNTSFPKNSRSGYMLRATQQRGLEVAENIFKESCHTENAVSLKAGGTCTGNFGTRNYERRRKSFQQRVRNRISDLKEELFLWVSGKCQMTLARMRRFLVEAKIAKELCTTLLSEAKSAMKQKELQEIQRMCDWLISQVSKAIQESSVNNSLLQYSSTSSSQTSFSTVGPSSSEFYSPTSDEGLDVTTNKSNYSSGNKISSNPYHQQKKYKEFSEMSCTKPTAGKALHMSSSDDEEIVKCSVRTAHGTEPPFSCETSSTKLQRIRGRKSASSLCRASMNRHLFKNISTQTSDSEDSDHPMESIEVSNTDIFSRVSTSTAVNGQKQCVTYEKNQLSNIPTKKSVGTGTSDTSAVTDTKQPQTISEIIQKVFPEREVSLTKIILNTSQENSTSWQPVIVENLCKNDTERTDEVGRPHLPSSNTQELIVLHKHGDLLSKNKIITVPNILGTRESETVLLNDTKQKASAAVSTDDCNKNSVETASVVLAESAKTIPPMESVDDITPALHSCSVPFSSSCHLQNVQQKAAQILTSPATLCDTEQHRKTTDSQELCSEEFGQGTKTSRKENYTLMKQPKRTESQKYLNINKTGICGNNYEIISDKPDCLLLSCSDHNQLGDSGFDTQHSSWSKSCSLSIPNSVSTLNSSVHQVSERGTCLSQSPQTQNCQSQSQGESISILAIPDATKKHYEATINTTRVAETEKGAGSIFKIMPSSQGEKPKPPFYEVPPQTIFDIVTLCLPTRGEYIPNDQLPEGFWENPDFPWLPEWIDDLDEWDE